MKPSEVGRSGCSVHLEGPLRRALVVVARPLGGASYCGLGTGDGRLLALLRRDRPSMLGVGLDVSDLMLDRARSRFAGDPGIDLVQHDLDRPRDV